MALQNDVNALEAVDYELELRFDFFVAWRELCHDMEDSLLLYDVSAFEEFLALVFLLLGGRRRLGAV